jgi:catechol 2,3-dioxygenase-like lactoylglutathione lyase family enzyme
MKRFHVNVAVADIEESVRFYRTLFGAEPAVQKSDYAKWMLEDPRLNFSVSASDRKRGINHLGLQADDVDELGAIQKRLAAAGEATLDQPNARCCYAESTKTWTRDPDDVAWETFHTYGEITEYGEDLEPESTEEACCRTETDDQCCAL